MTRGPPCIGVSVWGGEIDPFFGESVIPRTFVEECRGGSAACWHGRVQGVSEKMPRLEPGNSRPC